MIMVNHRLVCLSTQGKRIVYVSCDVTTVAPSYTPLPKKRGKNILTDLY